jgi:ADP-ribosylglycohydrolase
MDNQEAFVHRHEIPQEFTMATAIVKLKGNTDIPDDIGAYMAAAFMEWMRGVTAQTHNEFSQRSRLEAPFQLRVIMEE